MRHSSLPGFDSGSLTALSPQTPKRGRPPSFTDAELKGRCQRLLEFFEYYWPDVSWHLARAKTLQQVRAALCRAEKQSVHKVELFVLDSPKIGTPEQLFISRAELAKAEAQIRTAYEDEPETKQKYYRAKNAVEQFPQHPKLPDLLQRAESNWQYLSRQIERLNARVEKLRKDVREREAHFAQSQLLDFIQNAGRFRLNPLNVSKAMAGIPRISWRQSAQRLSKVEISHPFGFQHELWQTFSRGFGKSVPKNAKQCKERFQSFLQGGPKRSNVFQRLRAEFYYVKLGIENAYGVHCPKSVVACTAFVEYRKRSMAPQLGDEVLAEEEQLN